MQSLTLAWNKTLNQGLLARRSPRPEWSWFAVRSRARRKWIIKKLFEKQFAISGTTRVTRASITRPAVSLRPSTNRWFNLWGHSWMTSQKFGNFLIPSSPVIHSRLSRSLTARGSCTGLVTVGPTKLFIRSLTKSLKIGKRKVLYCAFD